MFKEHGVRIQAFKCIFCGDSQSRKEAILSHQVTAKCAPIMERKYFEHCEFCDAAFFFKNKDYNTLYIGHLNKMHPEETREKWNEKYVCSQCSFHFPNPEILEKHVGICVQVFHEATEGEKLELPTSAAGNATVTSQAIRSLYMPCGKVSHNFSPSLSFNLYVQACGICGAENKGIRDAHHQHAQDCMIKRKAAVTCSMCPGDMMVSAKEFANHCWTKHNLSTRIAMSCANCGLSSYDITELSCHQNSCLPKLRARDCRECEFCNTVYFFPNKNNVFYQAHMNNHHRNQILSSWRAECLQCGFRMPDAGAMRFHHTVCLFKKFAKPYQAIASQISEPLVNVEAIQQVACYDDIAAPDQDVDLVMPDDIKVEPAVEMHEEEAEAPESILGT